MEADWPDAYRVNRYVRGRAGAGEASEALGGFQRFPQWMWRNADVLDFVGWLRAHNDARPEDRDKVGFYGLDLYSLRASMAAVLAYLRLVDPAAARRAERRYACFDQFGDDPQTYGYSTAAGLAPTCEDEVIRQLVELVATAAEYARRDGRLAPDAYFFAAQNAKVVTSAERVLPRDVPRARELLEPAGHAHGGDARRAVDLPRGPALRRQGRRLGPQLAPWRCQGHRDGAAGRAQPGPARAGARPPRRPCWWASPPTAAPSPRRADWDAPAERKRVRPALRGSYEALFHETAIGNFYLDLGGDAAKALEAPRLERAIGVVYRPDTERQSHYFHASLPRQFDAVLHYDRTRAVEPLERTPAWEQGEAEVPETYPTAL